MPDTAIWRPRDRSSINGTQQDNAKSISCCADVSLARYFTNYVGVQAEGDFHKNGGNYTAVVHDQFSGGSGGLIFRYPTEDITPFAHALVGGESVSSTYYPSNKWGMVLTVGGGIDYNTPWLDHHLPFASSRPIIQYAHVNMYPVVRGNFDMARLSTGVVLNFGTMAPPPTVTIACAAQPNSVFPGEPITVTATVGNALPKDHVIYTGLVRELPEPTRPRRWIPPTWHRAATPSTGSERRQARQRRPEAMGERLEHRDLHGEGIRAADTELLGESDRSEAG